MIVSCSIVEQQISDCDLSSALSSSFLIVSWLALFFPLLKLQNTVENQIVQHCFLSLSGLPFIFKPCESQHLYDLISLVFLLHLVNGVYDLIVLLHLKLLARDLYILALIYASSRTY